MSQILNGSIDLNKIDKSKIKTVTLKDGSIAKFFDISIFINDEQDKYNNIASISGGQSKEERESKTPKIYLGNLKRTWSSDKAQAPANNTQNDNEDLF